MILFIALMGYLVYFTIVRAKTFVNSPYNQRQNAFAENVIRGDITDRNGNVLARTDVAEDGTETRVYPYGSVFSHVIGYSDPQLGKTGIESVENFELLTSNAFFVERIQNEFNGEKDRGDTVVTTLDADLQQAAYDALGDNRGAVVVMEADTGKILSMVSKPDYDPGKVEENWSELSSSKDSILLNRAMQGLYPPGSTFKTVTLLEYLREHQMDGSGYAFHCTGSVSVGNSSISCYHGTAHGDLDLTEAFARSCNSAFADMGRNLDVESLQTLSDQLLFDSDLPLSFPYSKSSFSLDEDDGEALRMMTAIGQGDTLVTPMHMAMLVSAVANDGVLMVPRFMDRTENYTGQLVERYSTETYGELMILQEYMRAAVENGTASALDSDAYTAAGKTGSAEYSSDKSKSHAWFIGYAAGDKPDLAVCVLVEEAGSGSEYAVPIAKRIFDAYYAD